jgi:hypothetical protein
MHEDAIREYRLGGFSLGCETTKCGSPGVSGAGTIAKGSSPRAGRRRKNAADAVSGNRASSVPREAADLRRAIIFRRESLNKRGQDV